MRLADITADDIDWYATLLPAAPTRRTHTYALLSTIMRSEHRSPPADLRFPARSSARSSCTGPSSLKPATPQQIATIVENMPEKYRALILLAAWCGSAGERSASCGGTTSTWRR